MHYLLISQLFAQVYGGGSYSSSNYQDGITTTAQTGGSTLSNTGFDILVVATAACVIIFIALLIRFWKRPKAAAQQ